GDMPKILMGGLKRRAEETAGGLDRLAERQADEASERAREARSRIEILTPFAVKIASSNLPSGKVVLRASGLTGGHDPDRPIIRDFAMDIIGPERVAITGGNGVGKSTLLKLLTGSLMPQAGSVQIGGPMALLDLQVALIYLYRYIIVTLLWVNPLTCVNY